MGVMFPSLFQPGYIGKVKIKNRIAKAATYTGYSDTLCPILLSKLEHLLISRGGNDNIAQ